MNAPKIPKKWKKEISLFVTYLRSSGQTEKTIDTRRQHLNYLARRIGVSPRKVTPDLLIDWCGVQKWAQESRRSRYATYRRFWWWAKKYRGFNKNCAKALPDVKAKPGLPRPVPEDIYQRAIHTAAPRTVLILRLARECGLRRSEIAHIHETDLIDDLVGWSLIVKGKGDRKRIVPIPDDIADEILTQGGWLFPGNQQGHLSPERVGELATQALDGVWTLHTLRHRFATSVYQVEKDLLSVQMVLGHSSAETTRRYVAHDTKSLRNQMWKARSSISI